MGKQEDIAAARGLVRTLDKAITALTRHYPNGVDVRRLRADAERLDADIDEAADIYRVRLGPYRNARAASAALARLEASGYPGALITR